MTLITLRQSATGSHHFRCDGRLLWISKDSEPEIAIANFLEKYPTSIIIREDYNPKQPRDARGRWTSGGGGGSRSGGGGGGRRGGSKKGLAVKKVSELQDIARKEGIDIDTLSHKNRKSVLTAAIKAKRKGNDLREAGLLKATKPKTSLAKARAKNRQRTKAKPQSKSDKTPPEIAFTKSKTKTHAIKTDEEFETVALNVFDTHSRDGFMPVYQLRREIGETVPRDKFNEHLLNMQANDKFQLFGGSTGSSEYREIRDSISTESMGLRTYVRLAENGDKALASSRKHKSEVNKFLADKPELEPLGTASKFKKGKKISSEQEFNPEFEQALKALDKEMSYDNLVPISDIRAAFGNRVSPQQFNDYLIELQGNDKVQLSKGTNLPTPDIKKGGFEDPFFGGTYTHVQRL